MKNKTATECWNIRRGELDSAIGVRANIHWGGADRVLPEWIRWGGGSRQKFSEIHILWGGRFFSVNCSNRPENRVIQTCIVFCPNNVDSLPEFMSTNCPNWGGGCPPAPRPVRLWIVLLIVMFP